MERFKEYLSGKVTVTNEEYELRFLGKNYARLLASVDTNMLKRRHRLAAAYNAYQELQHSMSTVWDIPCALGWIDDLPEYLSEAADEGEELEPIRGA